MAGVALCCTGLHVSREPLMSNPASDRPPLVPLSSAQWIMLLLLAMVQFTNVLDFVIMMPLAPQFHKTWNLTPQEFGYLVSVYAFAACASGIVSSWFIDRLDRKNALVVLYGIFGIANLLCAWSPSYAMMMMARIVAGLSGGILGGVIMAIIGDVIPYARRGFATGIVMSSFAVASIVGIPFGLHIALNYSWRWTFMVIACASLAMLPLAIWRLPAVRAHINGKPGQAPWLTTWAIVSDVNHLRAFMLMAFLIMTTFIIVPYMPTYMVANVEIKQEDIMWIYLFGGLGTLLTMGPIGKLSDRYGKKIVFQYLAILAAIPLLAVSYLPKVPLYVALIVTTAMMVFTAGRSVPAMAMCTACTTNERRGGFMSMLGAIQQFAMGVATVVGGLILGVQAGVEPLTAVKNAPGEILPIEPISGFPIVGWIAAILSLITAYLGSHLRAVDTPAAKTTLEQAEEVMVTEIA
ncbi:MAG TPA: MFS transporter [Gemmatales bacterium]|nr:MFS transporter [Gemmatales bacterium]